MWAILADFWDSVQKRVVLFVLGQIDPHIPSSNQCVVIASPITMGGYFSYVSTSTFGSAAQCVFCFEGGEFPRLQLITRQVPVMRNTYYSTK